MKNEIVKEEHKHGICIAAIEMKNSIEGRFLKLGQMLYLIKTQRLHEAGWDSWEDFEMELKLPASTVSRLIRLYEIFELRFKIAPAQIAKAGGWTVVAEFLPDISEDTKRGEVEGWMDEAALMPRTDLRRTIVERRKGTDMTKCSHKDTYQLKVCRDCGDRWKILK